MSKKYDTSYVHEAFKYLHSVPEKAMEEYKTSAYIAQEIKKFGYEVHEKIGVTGIVAMLDSGKPGPVVAIRADMDALSYPVDGKVVCRHTCGHDGHSSMVLTAAKIIAEKGLKSGKLIVIFQPGEEPIKGALAMLGTGFFDNLGIEELYGIHVRPRDDMKVGQATPAVYHSASGRLRLKLSGKSGSTERPDLAVNVADAAVLAINAVNTIHMNPTIQYSIKTTHINMMGSNSDGIQDYLEMIFDLKHQNTQMYGEMREKATLAFKEIAESVGAEAEVESIEYVPGAQFTEDAIQVVRNAIIEEMGEEACLPVFYNTGGDDFHYFVSHLGCKSAFIGLGADAYPGLHHQDMHFDESCLDNGVKLFVNIINQRLGLKA